jgi:hypothetical protein
VHVDETFALSGLHLFWNVLSLVAHHVRDNLGVLVSNLIMTASQRTDTANICKNANLSFERQSLSVKVNSIDSMDSGFSDHHQDGFIGSLAFFAILPTFLE